MQPKQGGCGVHHYAANPGGSTTENFKTKKGGRVIVVAMSPPVKRKVNLGEISFLGHFSLGWRLSLREGGDFVTKPPADCNGIGAPDREMRYRPWDSRAGS